MQHFTNATLLVTALTIITGCIEPAESELEVDGLADAKADGAGPRRLADGSYVIEVGCYPVEGQDYFTGEFELSIQPPEEWRDGKEGLLANGDYVVKGIRPIKLTLVDVGWIWNSEEHVELTLGEGLRKVRIYYKPWDPNWDETTFAAASGIISSGKSYAFVELLMGDYPGNGNASITFDSQLRLREPGSDMEWQFASRCGFYGYGGHISFTQR